jgi:hypothetical protein
MEPKYLLHKVCVEIRRAPQQIPCAQALVIIAGRAHLALNLRESFGTLRPVKNNSLFLKSDLRPVALSLQRFGRRRMIISKGWFLIPKHSMPSI